MALTWTIKVDWDNDGSYAYDEASYVTALNIERGRSDQFSTFEAGKCVLTLDNATRRFDPWYASGALYPNVAPRRAVKVQCTYSGTTYDLFVGRIEEIEPTGHLGARMVTLTAYDGLRDLTSGDVQATLLTGQTTDVCIASVLDDAGWPAGAGYRDLDVGNDTLAYWWTAGGETALAACNALTDSEHGLFFVNHAGQVVFVNRQNFATTGATASLDEDQISDLLLSSPWESVFNQIRVRVNPVTAAALAPVWTLQDLDVFVLPGAALELWAEYTDANGTACAADGVLAPVATTDYTANTAQGGVGTDMTASMSVAASIYSTWAKLTVTNTSAVTAFYITALQMRGTALTQEATTVRRERSASLAAYGRRTYTVDLPWQQGVNVGGDLADTLANFYDEPQPLLTVQLDNLFPDLLKYDLCERLAVTIGSYDIDQVFRIGGLSLTTGQTMQDVRGAFRLEPSAVEVFWLLGIVGNSEVGVSTTLGY